MKSRKNTINGKVIVTGDVNELEPNEVLINEKLNEDGTVSLDIKDISNSVKVEGADDNGIFFKFVHSSSVIYNIHNNFYNGDALNISGFLLPGHSVRGDLGAYTEVINNKTLEYSPTSTSASVIVTSVQQPISIVIDDEVYELPAGSQIHKVITQKCPERIIIMDSKLVKTLYEIYQA